VVPVKYDDEKFIELARTRGYLDEAKLEVAKKSREDMAEMGVKDEFLVGDVLLQNGAITQEQHDEIVRELASSRIPGYVLDKVIGRGMAGTTYLARKSMTDQPVQIKIMETGGDETLEKRFAREAAVAKQLRHKNVVGALGVGKEGNIFYFISEHFTGQTGKDKLRDGGPIAEQDGLKVLESIASGLEAVWALKIVHRDIKPENILFTEDGTIKLMELGTVKSTSAEAQALTMPGMVLGSVDYMSPEQAMGGQPLDVRADIFSLGATVYELLTGKTPFDGVPPGDRAKGKYPSPRERNPQLSDTINRIITRCLQPAVDLRYQTPAELIADVQRIRSGRSLSHAAQGTGRTAAIAPVSAPEADHTILWAILIGVGLGLVGLGIAFLVFF
jgi:serine/threonine-protein kinase